MFQPVIEFARLQPLLDALEQARRDIEALEIPPALERALQRATEARGAHMSTRIEGNPMTEAEVRAEFARVTPGGILALFNWLTAIEVRRNLRADLRRLARCFDDVGSYD